MPRGSLGTAVRPVVLGDIRMVPARETPERRLDGGNISGRADLQDAIVIFEILQPVDASGEHRRHHSKPRAISFCAPKARLVGRAAGRRND
jgi:hypothetical protein